MFLIELGITRSVTLLPLRYRFPAVDNGLLVGLPKSILHHATRLLISTLFSPEQLSKAHESIDVTELGMLTDVKPLQPWKALFPIEVTELGIAIELKPEQELKAPPSIVVTELGIVTEARPLQPLKAALPIEVTEFGIVTEVNPQISWNPFYRATKHD